MIVCITGCRSLKESYNAPRIQKIKHDQTFAGIITKTSYSFTSLSFGLGLHTRQTCQMVVTMLYCPKHRLVIIYILIMQEGKQSSYIQMSCL